jgi:hypothetical protein
MNKISGKVVAKESGLGIPGLLVVVFDTDPGTTPEEPVLTRPQGRSSETPAAPGQGVHVGRLGSVLTDGTGAFTLTYEDEAFRVRNPQERRPDLSLTVLAPEEADSSGDSHVLFVSKAVRQNAGRTEQCLIRLSTDQLSKAGVAAPMASPDCPPDSRKIWDDYNHKQEFEHELINRKTTWSLTTQGILFAAYGVTFTATASSALSDFRSAVAIAGLVVAILTFIGVAFLITAKRISYMRYRDYFAVHKDCLPEPKGKKGKEKLEWGSAGGPVTLFTLLPDLGMPAVLIAAWCIVPP